MKKLLAVTLLSLVPALAHADDKAAAAKVVETIDPILDWLQAMRTEAGATEHANRPTAASCHAAIAAGRKAGLGDDAKLYATGLYTLDEARYDDDKQPYLALADMDALCTEYGKWLLIAPAAAAQADALEQVALWSSQDAGTYPASFGKGLADKSTSCRAITLQAIAAGAPKDWKTTEHGQPLTLDEGLTQACQALEDIAATWSKETGRDDRAADDQVRAKYAALGVKGERLELYVQYDDTYWLGKGCEKITDPKKLKKAAMLFQWLEADDGTITIRKYTFKGDKVKGVSNKVYSRPDKAQRGCR